MADALRCWEVDADAPSTKLFLFMYEVVATYLRVDWDPPPVLLLRMTWDELLPFVFSAPGTPPCDLPVDVRIPLALPLLETFLIELFKLVLPAVCRITLSTLFYLILLETFWTICLESWFCSCFITVFYECSLSCF